MKDEEMAFPVSAERFTQYGMTLQDYFAGKALTALAHDYAEQKLKFNRADIGIAECAYKLADAMLAERDKRDNETTKD